MTTTRAGAATQSAGGKGILDRFFHLTERGTTPLREVRGGIVTFFSMVYILALNPIILSGPDSEGGYLGGGSSANTPAIAAGTALVAGLMCILMGTVANFPLAIAAGLGLNSILAASIVQIPGMTWADGMGIIVLEGIVIILLVLTGLREAIFRAVPRYLRMAISVGIGMFITFLGLVNAGIVSRGGENGPPLSFGVNGSISTWPLFVFIFGLILTAVLMVRGVKGSILIGIVASTILAAVVEAVFHVSRSADGGWGTTEPRLEGSPIQVPHFDTFGQFSLTGPFQKIGVVAVIVLAFSVMLADFFDTMGTMVAVAAEGDLLDDEGNPPNTRSILLIDSVAAVAGGAGGVSSNTSYIESSTGVADGARTGLATVCTGVLFLLSTFLAPIAKLVPDQAAAPALVAVGFLMMQQVAAIDWDDLAIGIPAFLTIVFMPFGYSITVGIGMGFIAHAIMQVARGRARKVHPLLWVVCALFVVYFLLDPIQSVLGL
ncbi:MAG: NCS2 family permease [Actinomycetaceae bacterium]|nr:NCS2 family permease [Actinomycetaceae bacterium]